jgi:hypothetical protein
MNNKTGLKIGTKVNYSNNGIIENGIIKDLSEDTPVSVRVVYNWSDEPENYMNYTGALTSLRNLSPGWSDEAINNL